MMVFLYGFVSGAALAGLVLMALAAWLEQRLERDDWWANHGEEP